LKENLPSMSRIRNSMNLKTEDRSHSSVPKTSGNFCI
jgi:hypothetical protein